MTTPTKLFLCGRNLADEGVLSTTVAAVSTLPVSNLKRSSRARVWRSSSAAAVDIIVDLSTSTSDRINVVMLGRHNLEPNAAWRVQMYTTYDASGAASYDSGAQSAYPAAPLGSLDWGVDPLGSGLFDAFLGQRYSVWYFMENTATVINSVRITVTDTGNSAGYVQASRLFVGKGIELGFNPKTLRLRWNEDTKQQRTDGGTLLSDGSLSFREMSAELEWVIPNDRAALHDLARFAGMRKDIFVSAFPGVGGETERDYTFVGRMTKMPDLSNVVGLAGGNAMFTGSFDFAEI